MTTKDKDIWEAYKHGMQLVPKRKLVSHKTKIIPQKAIAQAAASNEIYQTSQFRFVPSLTETAFNPLERSREKALRLGDIKIDAKLDLHGMTQPEAFAALSDFMLKSAKAGKRHLLIITGKGKENEGGGVLRRNLENWLVQLPESQSIMALRPAAPKHGGMGAVYVVMRKK